MGLGKAPDHVSGPQVNRHNAALREGDVKTVAEKGYLTTNLNSLINWARSGSFMANDVWASLLCCRNDAHRG